MFTLQYLRDSNIYDRYITYKHWCTIGILEYIHCCTVCSCTYFFFYIVSHHTDAEFYALCHTALCYHNEVFKVIIWTHTYTFTTCVWRQYYDLWFVYATVSEKIYNVGYVVLFSIVDFVPTVVLQCNTKMCSVYTNSCYSGNIFTRPLQILAATTSSNLFKQHNSLNNFDFYSIYLRMTV